ncbi:SlyX family protein [Neisseria meningitidis]|uniref:SlyX family protein n=1 Tax=Neisseria meningitidis TaxID=487 RepID=UPI0005DCC738|nr:SlyX family protein [Neisseria meningitidis]CFB00191.1 SLYX protein [Neisseria meningitidis]
MDGLEGLECRIVELEIQSALQEDVIVGLNAMVAELRQMLDLQQAQLRLLYSKLQDKNSDAQKPYSLRDEIPPHY